MFRAMIKDTSEWISAVEMNLDELRSLGRAKSIICPDCGATMNVRAGTKTPHFYHIRGTNCTNLFSEPETEEHLKGKLAIYEYLKENFPNHEVELEYRVEETKQRSDVMLLLNTGEKVAFEFQCSSISYDAIMERRYLYKNANVVDIWVFGDSVHKYGVSNKKEDKWKHRLKGMEKAVYEQEDKLWYLDVITNQVRVLDEYAIDRGTQLRTIEAFFSLDELMLENNTLISPRDIERRLEKVRIAEAQKKRKIEWLNNYCEVVAFRAIDLYDKESYDSRRHVLSIIKEYKNGIPDSLSLVRDPACKSGEVIVKVDMPESSKSKSKITDEYKKFIDLLEEKYNVDSPMKWVQINGVKSYNHDLYSFINDPHYYYDIDERFEWSYTSDNWRVKNSHRSTRWDVKQTLLNTFNDLMNDEEDY